MDDEARRIFEEARATLKRVANVCVEEPDYLAIAMARPIEHPADKDRRELQERNAQWAREREREAAGSPAATSRVPEEWEAWLRARLDAERAFVLECVGTALGQALRKERTAAKRELADEVRSLRLELTEANEVVRELRQTVAAERNSGGAVIDLPAGRVN